LKSNTCLNIKLVPSSTMLFVHRSSVAHEKRCLINKIKWKSSDFFDDMNYGEVTKLFCLPEWYTRIPSK